MRNHVLVHSGVFWLSVLKKCGIQSHLKATNRLKISSHVEALRRLDGLSGQVVCVTSHQRQEGDEGDDDDEAFF